MDTILINQNQKVGHSNIKHQQDNFTSQKSQGSKGIRQWADKLMHILMMIHKITLSLD